jgi:hypothetical protein
MDRLLYGLADRFTKKHKVQIVLKPKKFHINEKVCAVSCNGNVELTGNIENCNISIYL